MDSLWPQSRRVAAGRRGGGEPRRAWSWCAWSFARRPC